MTGPWTRLLIAASMALSVAACGVSTIAGVGGGGSGGTGIAGGIITGFGSIVVDGNRWDVRNASIVREIAPSRPLSPTDAKLGQSVEIDFAESGTASTVRIEPGVIGPVGSVDTVSDPATLTVAGQTIQINADPEAGPVTFFVNYASSADIVAGDIVEIHGSPFYDAAGGQYAIQAARIEKLDALPAGYVRVAGILQSLSASGFQLGGLTVRFGSGTQIVPLARNLDNGYRIVVWGRQITGTTPTLAAEQIRIKSAPPVAGPAEVSGVVSRFDSARLTFELNGVLVDASAADAVGPIANGAYASVSGMYLGDGTLSAARVQIRLSSESSAQVQIAGSITNFVTLERFLVRGVRIDAAGANTIGCGDTPLGYGRYVQVAANIVDNVVTASSVTCVASPPADATLSYLGTAGTVDAVNHSVTLAHTEVGDLATRWTDTTLFNGVTPETLNGKWLAVEGYMQNGTLIITKVEPGVLAQAQAELVLSRQ